MNDLSKTLIEIATSYLGPGGERFMVRQVTSHLEGGVTLETLQPAQLPELSKWIEVSAALLIDKTQAAEFAQKIQMAA